MPGFLESKVEIHTRGELVIVAGAVAKDGGDVRGHGDAVGSSNGQANRDTVKGIIEFVHGANHSLHAESETAEVHGPARGDFDVGIANILGGLAADTDIQTGHFRAQGNVGLKVIRNSTAAKVGVIGDPDGEIEATQGLRGFHVDAHLVTASECGP